MLFHNISTKEYIFGGMVFMPEISLFRGIRITMYYSDHNPPHFHAEYAGHKCLVDVLFKEHYLPDS